MSQKLPPVLIDFDGILRIGNKPAADVSEFLTFIENSGMPAIVLSNSSLKSGRDIIEFLKDNLIRTSIPAITTVDAVYNLVKEKYKRVSVYCIDPVKNLFKNFIDDNNPEAVIIGDLGDRWNYEILNDIFLKVFNGSDLIAMHKNKYWMPDGKNLSLDAGAFVSAVEYSASKEAILIGKPSQIYFKAALERLAVVEGEEFFMIGDDIENDIYPVQDLGGLGILVYTGKTKFPLEHKYKKPDFEASNLTGAISILKKVLKLLRN